MSSSVSETLFSAQTLLWLAASAVAALLLFGSINRRRGRLTDSLREYVDKNRQRDDAAKPEANEAAPRE